MFTYKEEFLFMSGFIKRTAAALVLSIGLLNTASADEIYSSDFVSFYPATSACDPCGKWLDNISVYGSWLYWKVNGDEYDYAVEKTRLLSTEGIIRDRETIHDVKFGWDSGFRIGVGAELPSLCWRADVVWTHFRDTSSKSTEIHGTIGNEQTLVSLPAAFNFGDQLGSGESAVFTGRVNFRYDTVDIEFGKWCCCTDCVKFRPHIGLRLAEIHDGFHDKVEFAGGAQENFSETAAPFGRFFAKNRFKGAGIRAGLDLDLCLCEGLSLIGRGAGSIVWGRTRLSQSFKYPFSLIGDFYHGEIDESYRNSKIITDLSLGIRYKTMCGCFPVIAELAWEHHFIFSKHRFWIDNAFAQPLIEADLEPIGPLLTTSSWKKNGSVSLQGVTLSLGVEF
jgi:hypothetical protein